MTTASAPCTTSVANATASCVSNACSHTCNTNYVANDGACVPPPPHPVSPLTGNAVSTRTPTLTWQTATGFPEVHLDVCFDRACQTVLWSSDVTGSSVTVGTPLPATTVFWRLFSVDGSVDGGAASPLSSPVWEFAGHGTNSASLATSWQLFNDFDGDGYADVILYDYGGSQIQVFPGGASGASTVSEWTVQSEAVFTSGDFDGNGTPDVLLWGDPLKVYYSTAGSGLALAATSGAAPTGGTSYFFADDINGDGYSDVVAVANISGTYSLVFYPGSSSGLVTASPQVVALPQPAPAGGALAAPAGDVNGDGFADILVPDGSAVYVYLGSASGLPSGPARTLGAPANVASWGSYERPAMLGDVNGDGYGDVALFGVNNNSGLSDYGTFVYFGSASGLPLAPSETIACGFDNYGYADLGGGDVNGDGYSDLICGGDEQTGTLGLFAGSSTGLPTTTSTTLTNSDGEFQAQIPVGDLNDDGYGDFMGTVEGTNGFFTFTFLGGTSFPTSDSSEFDGYDTYPGGAISR